MTILEMKKHGERFEVNLFYSKKSKSHYHSIIDKDAKKLAQVLMDLYLEGFPIEKAIEIMRERFRKKDLLGF